MRQVHLKKSFAIPQLDGGGYDNDEDYAAADETPSSSESEFSDEASASEENDDIQVTHTENVRRASRVSKDNKTESPPKRVTRQQNKKKTIPLLPKRSRGRPSKQANKERAEATKNLQDLMTKDNSDDCEGKVEDEKGKFLCKNCKKRFENKSSLQGHLYWCAPSRITRSRGGDGSKRSTSKSERNKLSKTNKAQKAVAEGSAQPSTSTNQLETETFDSEPIEKNPRTCESETTSDNKPIMQEYQIKFESGESDYETKLTKELQPVVIGLDAIASHLVPNLIHDNDEDIIHQAACPKCKMIYRNQASLQKHLSSCMYSSSSCSSEDEEEIENDKNEEQTNELEEETPFYPETNNLNSEIPVEVMDESSGEHVLCIDEPTAPQVDENYFADQQHTNRIDRDSATTKIKQSATHGSENVSKNMLDVAKTEITAKVLTSNSPVVTSAKLFQQALAHDITIYSAPVMSNLIPKPTTLNDSEIHISATRSTVGNTYISMPSAAVTNTVTVNSSPVTVPHYGVSPFSLNQPQSYAQMSTDSSHQILANSNLSRLTTDPAAPPHYPMVQSRQIMPDTVMPPVSAIQLQQQLLAQTHQPHLLLNSPHPLQANSNPVQQQSTAIPAVQHPGVSLTQAPTSSAFHFQSQVASSCTVSSNATTDVANLGGPSGVLLNVHQRLLMHQNTTDDNLQSYNRNHSVSSTQNSVDGAIASRNFPRLQSDNCSFSRSEESLQSDSADSNVQSLSNQFHTSFGIGPQQPVSYPTSSTYQQHQQNIGLYGQNLQQLTNETTQGSPIFQSQGPNGSSISALFASQQMQRIQQQPLQSSNYQILTFQDSNGQVLRMNVPVPLPAQPPAVGPFSPNQFSQSLKHGSTSTDLPTEQPSPLPQQLQITHQHQLQMAQQQFHQGTQGHYISQLPRNQTKIHQFQSHLPQGQLLYQSQVDPSKQLVQNQMLHFVAQQHPNMQALTNQQSQHSQLYMPQNQTQCQPSQSLSHLKADPTQSFFHIQQDQCHSQIQHSYQLSQPHTNQTGSDSQSQVQTHQNMTHVYATSQDHPHPQISQNSSTIQRLPLQPHLPMAHTQIHFESSQNQSQVPGLQGHPSQSQPLNEELQTKSGTAVKSTHPQPPPTLQHPPPNEVLQALYQLPFNKSHCRTQPHQPLLQQQPQNRIPQQTSQILLPMQQPSSDVGKESYETHNSNSWTQQQDLNTVSQSQNNQQLIKTIHQSLGVESNQISSNNNNTTTNQSPSNVLNQPYPMIQLANGNTYIVVQSGGSLGQLPFDNVNRSQLLENSIHSPQLQNTPDLSNSSYLAVQPNGNLQNLGKLAQTKVNFLNIDSNIPCISNSSQAQPCPCPRCSLRVAASTVADKYRKVLPFPRPIEPKIHPLPGEQTQSAETSPGLVKTYMKRTINKTVKSQLANMIMEKQNTLSAGVVEENDSNVSQQDDTSTLLMNTGDGTGSSQCPRKNPILTAVVRPMEHPLQKMSDQISQIESSFNATTLVTRQPTDINQINEVLESARKESPSMSSRMGSNSESHLISGVATQAEILPAASIIESIPAPVTVTQAFSADPLTIVQNGPIQVSANGNMPTPTTPTRSGIKRKADSGTSATSSPAKSIKVTLKRKEGGDSYSIKDVSETGGNSTGSMRSLKIKAKITSGEFAGTSTDVVVEPKIHVVPIPDPDAADLDSNLTIDEGESTIVSPVVQTIPVGSNQKQTDSNLSQKMTHRAVVVYEVKCNETILFRSSDVRAVWSHIFETVQGTRLNHNLPPLSYPATNISLENKQEPTTTFNMLGLTHRAVQFLLQHLPKKKSEADKHTFRFHQPQKPAKSDEEVEINATGCARTEGYTGRKPFDMCGWLASKHRKPPEPIIVPEEIWKNNGQPMALCFRSLKRKSGETLTVMWSTIHGRGLYTRRPIEKGEMIIEYAGEVIRSLVCDQREKYYETKAIGCYMFRINDEYVIDATMKGNSARFINHSCDPNCESKAVKFFGKEHIVIFALRKISSGEELTYDYKFEKEDNKIPCLCASKKCRKYLN